MVHQIRVIVESLNDAGDVVGTEIVMTKSVVKPNHIIELGLRHSEQIDLLRQIEQQLLDKQSIYLKEELLNCPKCSGKLYKSGYVKSDFHAVFTDHKVSTSRQVCKLCNWTSTPSVRSLFGNASHPDLVKIQTELGANHTFREAQKLMNLFSNTQRATNNHDRIKYITETVGQDLCDNPEAPPQKIPPVSHLYVQVDGGHVATTERDKRSFEVMTSVVFDAKNIEYTGGKDKKNGKVSGIRGRLTSKHCAASALLDSRDTMKQQTLNAAIKQGMTPETKLTAICDGATNCWDIVDSLEKKCHSIERILDWHHIAMKFQNARLGQKDVNEQLSGTKWYLWHGKPDEAIERLQSIRDSFQDNPKNKEKVQRLLTYIENNANFIVNYQKRQDDGLIFTSQMAECTVESLINKRCKGQQHMRWSRDGLHALLQVRAAVNSNDWSAICERHIDTLYNKTA
jgi:hypothetical protein